MRIGKRKYHNTKHTILQEVPRSVAQPAANFAESHAIHFSTLSSEHRLNNSENVSGYRQWKTPPSSARARSAQPPRPVFDQSSKAIFII
jgi:hypothetical protein